MPITSIYFLIYFSSKVNSPALLREKFKFSINFIKGKTSLFNVLTGLTEPDEGSAEFFNLVGKIIFCLNIKEIKDYLKVF